MTYPNLAGVITKDDVFRKGTGSYAADYVSWARIANHLHANAPGWQFALMQDDAGSHVWKAPDGSGYIMGYFRGPDGESTVCFPYPCQDHRNQPVAFDKVSCRVLTDTHRRGLCAAAAYFFSLGYELWAREEVEEAKGEPASPPVTPSAPAKAKPAAAATKDESAPDLDAEDLPITDKDLKTIRDLLAAEVVVKRNKIIKEFNKAFEVPEGELMTAHITLPKHLRFIQERLST
jgi:hypothetical protein